MANIKKAIVPASSLPPVSPDNKYFIRFRIASEDKNRLSHWSKIIEVDGLTPTPVGGTLSFADGVLSVVWDDANNYPDYDIFISEDGGEMTYHGTSSVHNYEIRSSATASIDVVIQVANYKKVISEILEIYSGSIDLSLI